MRATEFIRELLDLIDQATDNTQDPVTDYESECDTPEVETVRLANQPDEMYADIKKVTVDAGGGLNGPKHPADLRADSFSMYPNTQYNPRKQ